MRAISDLMASLSSLTDGTVRQMRMTAEDPPRVSVTDVVSLVTGQTAHNAAITTQRQLENYPEVASNLSNFDHRDLDDPGEPLLLCASKLHQFLFATSEVT